MRTFPALLLVALLLPGYSIDFNEYGDRTEKPQEDTPFGEKDTSDFKESPMGSHYVIENRGQIEDLDVLFYYSGNPAVYLRSDGISVESTSDIGSIEYGFHVLGAGNYQKISRSEEGPVFNYLIGNDPEKWTSGARSYGSIKNFGEIRKEEWRADGSWYGIIEMPAGSYASFLNKLGNITKGNGETKVLTQKT